MWFSDRLKFPLPFDALEPRLKLRLSEPPCDLACVDYLSRQLLSMLNWPPRLIMLPAVDM